MKTKTPEELVRELRDVVDDFTIPTVSWQARAEWHTRLRACIAALEAAIANPTAGAVGRLVEHLNANADDFNRWQMEMKSLIVAVEAELAMQKDKEKKRRFSADPPGRHTILQAGNEVHITFPPEGNIITVQIDDDIVEWELPNPPKPTAKRPWRLPSGMLMCPACEIKQAALSAACRNDECRQYAQTWGDPRDLPSGEEVGG